MRSPCRQASAKSFCGSSSGGERGLGARGVDGTIEQVRARFQEFVAHMELRLLVRLAVGIRDHVQAQHLPADARAPCLESRHAAQERAQGEHRGATQPL